MQKHKLALLGGICLILVACSNALSQAKDLEDQLIQWVVSNGGKVELEIGKACDTCFRGTLASRDFQTDEIIMLLPHKLAVLLDDGTSTDPAFSARNELIRRWHMEPEFNATYELYFKTLPQADGLFIPEMYSKEQMSMLQCRELERVVKDLQREAKLQFQNKSHPPSVNTYLPGKEITYEQFLVGSALMSTRQFGFEKEEKKTHDYLLPILDLVNHHHTADNTEVTQQGEDFILKAIKPIKKGEELFHNYNGEVMHRVDNSLLLYGFVQQVQEPLLAAADHPALEEPLEHFPNSDADDDELAAGGEYATQAELDRLTGRWARLATTEDQDQQLWDNGNYTEWKDQQLLLFRLERKKALRLAISRLTYVLEEEERAHEAAFDEAAAHDEL